MASAPAEEHSQYFLQSLRRYTFSPLSTARSVVNREQREIGAERDAFEALSERVADITPHEPGNGPNPAVGLADHTPTGQKMELVSTAYRETVMAVPHYNTVYAESLDEHLASELGAEIADRVDSASTAFTKSFKALFLGHVAQAIQYREQSLDSLAEESKSIKAARDSLQSLFEELDTTIIPGWHSEKFAAALDSIAETRQRTLRNRTPGIRFDDHSLCASLYWEHSWTYPVLTAVARLHEAVTLRKHPENGNPPETY